MQEKSPAFQFYPRDCLADRNVAVMNTEEFGAYMKLLCFCWLEGSLPDDVEDLAMTAGVDVLRFQAMWAKKIGRCFRKADEGRLVHPRLDEERRKQEEYREQKSEAGRAGNAARWGGNHRAVADASQRDPGGIAKHRSSSASSSASSEEKEHMAPAAPGELEFPEVTPPTSPHAEAKRVLSEALEYLNRMTGRRFENTDGRLAAVKRILGNGRRLEDIRVVFWSKCKGPRKWLGDERMDAHVTPETLLRKANFQKYLEQAREELARERPDRAKQLGYLAEDSPAPKRDGPAAASVVANLSATLTGRGGERA